MTTVNGVELDPDQVRAAAAAPEDRQIVVAGPGSGKTEVVAELIRRLVEEHDVHPEDVLVISFSRAATHAVRRRLSGATGEAHLIEVRTLDALAGALVRDAEDEESPFRGHDATVVAATALLHRGDDHAVAQVQHVIVDEAQDVVGVRADFVAALLDVGIGPDCGFTVLGDPAQALYDFSGPSQNAGILTRLSQDAGVRRTELSHDYRARSPRARRYLDLRDVMLRGTPAAQRLHLLDVATGLPDLGDPEEVARTLASWEGSTAVLTRTNAEALAVADLLRAEQIGVSVQRSAAEESLAAWIATTLGDHPRRRIDRTEFATRLRSADAPLPPDTAWPRLRALSRARGADLDLMDLAIALDVPRVPRDLASAADTPVIVSTVHRAKGLEFDNVVLVDPEPWMQGLDDTAQEARVLYVALSRARSRVAIATIERDRSWIKEKVTGRWFKRGFRKGLTFGVELRGSDTRALGPTDVDLTALVGRPVTWTQSASACGLPQYDAWVDGLVVARTSPEFADDLTRRLRGRWPALLGGHVDGVETQVGNLRTERWPHGMWLSARVTGLINFDWTN